MNGNNFQLYFEKLGRPVIDLSDENHGFFSAFIPLCRANDASWRIYMFVYMDSEVVCGSSLSTHQCACIKDDKSPFIGVR